MGETNINKGLVAKPEVKRQLIKPRRRWDDNIKIYLEEIVCEGLDRFHLAQDSYQAFASTAMSIWSLLKGK
jgi:hypothetical protein